MTDKPMFFSHHFEVAQRKDFDPTIELSPENCKGLLGRYVFGDSEICQVRTENGVCHQKHQHGWLGITFDGKEGLIGRCCAKKYFKADDNFQKETRRIDDELARIAAIERINSYLENKKIIMEQLVGLKKQLIDTRRYLEDMYKSIPAGVSKVIFDAQKTRNWSINVDVRYVSTRKVNVDDEIVEREYYEWLPSTIGNFKRVSLASDVVSIILKIKPVISAFEELCSINIDECPTRKLNEYVKILSNINEIDSLTKKVSSETDIFKQPKNLDMLYYACDDEEEKFILVRYILKLNGNKTSDGYIRLRMKRISERFETMYDGRVLRKNLS
ncbi:hypothetical protein [Serratia fonticola]